MAKPKKKYKITREKRPRTSLRALLKGGVMVSTLLGFTWLSVYSYSTYGPGNSQGMTAQELRGFDTLLEQSLREADEHAAWFNASKRKLTFAEKRAELSQLFEQ